MTEEIRAPFTEGQQEALNRFQTNPTFHPFTCPRDGDVLVAEEAWRCTNRRCTYTQDWAHAFMADPGTSRSGRPPNP